jgi:hypothetical protein
VAAVRRREKEERAAKVKAAKPRPMLSCARRRSSRGRGLAAKMRAKAGAKRNASLADKASQVGAVSRRVEQARPPCLVIDSVIKKLIHRTKKYHLQEQLFGSDTMDFNAYFASTNPSWYSDEMYYASRCMEHARKLMEIFKGTGTRFMTVSTLLSLELNWNIGGDFVGWSRYTDISTFYLAMWPSYQRPMLY